MAHRDMNLSDYRKFRGLFMNFSEDELGALIAPNTKQELKRLRTVQKNLADFVEKHGNPTLLLRKNQGDMAIYVPLFFARGGLPR